MVHVVGTKYIDYFTDGTTETAYPGDPKIDANVNKANAPIPTHAGLTWAHTTGGYLYDTPSADLEVGDYAVRPNGSYIENAPPFVSSTFLGLLTLLNAPFDWASLGLTRALLRGGLELGGWWPFVLALVDALFAAIVIALLALTMMIGVQAFDDLAAHGGGEHVLPLGPFSTASRQIQPRPNTGGSMRSCCRP